MEVADVNKVESNSYIYENGLYRSKDIAFVNTAQFTETARYFVKHKTYTKAHPKWDKREYDDFWDEEERKCREGMSAPGQLLPDGSIQDVHITGEHYGYLNFAQIKLTKEDTDERLKGLVERVSKNQFRKSAEKRITFPDFWDGDYHYFTAKDFSRSIGLNLCVGKKRRAGYSYKNGWIAGNRANLYPDTITLLVAFDSGYLYPEGTMAMADKYLQFLNKHTDWRKGRLLDREDHIKFGYIDNDLPDIEQGFLSQILALSTGPNRPGAARGKDGTLIFAEESGVFPNLREFLKATQPTIEDGIYVTGQIIIFGTGGGDESNWEAFEEVFYKPNLYKCMAFDNIWDEGMSGTKAGFFVPQYWNMPGFIDKDGNSLKEEAIEHEKEKRELIKKESKDSSDLDGYVMERPFNPAEAFSRSTHNLFPAAEIDHWIRVVENTPEMRHLARYGKLVNTDKGIIFKHDEEHPPIEDFPLKKITDVHGCFVEWQPPFKVNGRIPRGMYAVWNDPYGTDKDKQHIKIGDSLGATYVYERANPWSPTRGDILVAAYIGRPESQDDYNELLLNICKYYNAECMFENDRGDVKGYFQRHKALHYLADEPEILWKKELQSKTGRGKGMHMTDTRIATGAIYLRDWLKTKRTKDDNGNWKWNLHYIYDLGLLKELRRWHKKGNFDRVSAMLVGQFHMQELALSQVEEPAKENGDNFFQRDLFVNNNKSDIDHHIGELINSVNTRK